MYFKVLVFNLLVGIISFVSGNLDQGKCIEGFKQCENGKGCVLENQVCDGVLTCQDNSDEKYCDKNATELIETTTSLNKDLFDKEMHLELAGTESEEKDQSSERNHNFNLPDDADHCKNYRRMINLVRKAHLRLSRLDKRTAKVIENLINEILMEADMENYSSLIELHKVCQNLANHHHHHTTTTQPIPTTTTSTTTTTTTSTNNL